MKAYRTKFSLRATGVVQMERDVTPQDTPGPETLADIAGIMVEGMIRNLKKTVPLFIGIFLGIWILHTFVLFFINQSIRGRGDLLGNMLAVTDGLVTGTLFWLLIAMLGTTVFLRIRQHGVNGYIREIQDIPGWITRSRSLYEAESAALIAAGIGIGGLIGAVLQNYLVSILITVLLLLSLTAREESVLILISGIGYSDLKRTFLKEPAFSPLEIERTTLVVTGCAAGFLLAAFIPRIGSLIIAVAALGYALYWYHRQEGSGKPPEAAAISIGILVLMAAGVLATPALAAVGGMPLSSSCSCPYNNTTTAIIVGIFPASATIAGILSTLTISGGASSLAGFASGMGSPGAGAAGGAGPSAAGASPARPESGIYGTGTPDDPFRDAHSIGRTEADGSLTPYPEQAGRPPEIIGRGTPDDPYRDNPEYRRYKEQSGEQGGAAPKPAPKQEAPGTTPETPVAPEMPEPETPGKPEMPEEPVPEREPPKTPETEPTPEHPQPEPETPAEPEMPDVEPEAEPPGPGEETMPEWRIQQLREHISELETREQEIRNTWQERRQIQEEYDQARREYTRQGIRTMFKMGKETVEACTDPKGTIYDGVKEKMGIETPLDKAKEDVFGREVTTEELTSEWVEIQTRRREIRSRLDSMPSREEMLEETREIKRKIRDAQQQIEQGVW